VRERFIVFNCFFILYRVIFFLTSDVGAIPRRGSERYYRKQEERAGETARERQRALFSLFFFTNIVRLFYCLSQRERQRARE
jgi:hypothetical protein